MKTASGVNVERQAVGVLEAFFQDIPNFQLEHLHRYPLGGAPDAGYDIRVEGRFAGRPVDLAVEVKSSGEPRITRNAIRRLQDATLVHGGSPVLMAPFFSEKARDACKEASVGYIDFLGNAHIAIDGIYIDRQVSARPEAERRALRSLFQPKSARIVRLLMRVPSRHWRIAELAHSANVSLGLVSTLGRALRERGWAAMTDQGLTLTDPDDLLDSWAEVYKAPRSDELRLYTHHQGAALIAKLATLPSGRGRVALSFFSAAEWLAPYVRQSKSYFYADEGGLAALQEHIDLSPSPKGANVVVRIPEDDGVLEDTVPVGPNLLATSPLQTYLDLMNGGERGQEGARHLRATRLNWRR